MKDNSTLDKDKRIKKEYLRLKKEFKEIGPQALKIVDELIQNAAFIGITLQDLQASINEAGTSEKYKHGANQWGLKPNPDVNTYNTMVKNYAALIKQLTDLRPKATQKEPEGDGFGDFLNER